MPGVLSQVFGLPGQRAAKTVSHRMITRGGWVPDILPQGKIIAGACTRDTGNTVSSARIRAGMLMGKISTVVNSLGTVGYYANSVLGVTTNAEAIGSTSIQASAAVVTELVRRCGASGTFNLLGPATAAGVIDSQTVTYSGASGTDITVTALTKAFVAGSFIMPTDGSDDPLTFLPSGTPIVVTDDDGTSLDVEFAEIPVNCVIDSSMLLPAWPSDTSLREWVVSRLTRASGGKFTWSHIW